MTDDIPDDIIMKMRESPANLPGTRWAAYRNVDLGHPEVGHLQFLAIGPENTLSEPPERMPDTERKLNWRYWFAGWLNLDTKQIEEVTNA